MVLGGELADRGTHERTVAADQFGRHLRQEPVGVELAVVDETDALAPERCKARRQANLLNAFRYDRLDQGTHSGSPRDLLDNIGSNNIQGCEPAQVRHTPRGGAAKRTRTPTPPERPLYRATHALQIPHARSLPPCLSIGPSIGGLPGPHATKNRGD